jgi:hypothetical protein
MTTREVMADIVACECRCWICVRLSLQGWRWADTCFALIEATLFGSSQFLHAQKAKARVDRDRSSEGSQTRTTESAEWSAED